MEHFVESQLLCFAEQRHVSTSASKRFKRCASPEPQSRSVSTCSLDPERNLRALGSAERGSNDPKHSSETESLCNRNRKQKDANGKIHRVQPVNGIRLAAFYMPLRRGSKQKSASMQMPAISPSSSSFRDELPRKCRKERSTIDLLPVPCIFYRR